MRRLQFVTVLALILASSALLAHQSHAMQTIDGTHGRITVSGEGVITTSPDMATIQFAIVSRSDDPEGARQANASASAKALNAIRDLGIDEKDIQLQNLNLNPIREYDTDRRVYIERGFEAMRTVTVTLKDLDTLPLLISTMVEGGVNRLNSIQYGLEDRDDIELEVLTLAVTRAKEKAEVMAAAMGLELGSLVEMNEHGVSVPRPVMRMEAAYDMASSKAAPEPDAYASGQIDVRTSVTIVFATK